MLRRFLTSQHHDPITGDSLTTLEFATRQVQAAMRTPWFIVGFNLITLVCLLFNWVLGWNTFASWLAVEVEWVVGTYVFGQTGRDAVYIRKIAKLEALNEVQLCHLEALLARKEDDAPGLDTPSPQPRCFQ